MEIAEHITIIGQEAKLLSEAAERGGLETDVPTCPGWDMRELVRHLGMIHLWAAGHVAFPHEEPDFETEEEELASFTEYWPTLGTFWPDDDELIDWYVETHSNLVSSLEAAPDDVDSWTFLPAPTPKAMWARRQAHETAVHRFDAEEASGDESGFDAAFADDGIDELLAAFAPRGTSFPVDEASSMLVHATDTGTRWHVTMSPEGITTFKGTGPTDVTLAGRATDLYLAVWNRGDDSAIDVDGDLDVLDTWRQNYRIRWSWD